MERWKCGQPSVMWKLTFSIAFTVVEVLWLYQAHAIRCYTCSSNRDSSCILGQDEGSATIDCDKSCVSAILPDTSLFRGCLADLLQETSKMQSCKNDLCNADVYPRNRLKCYQCQGRKCADVTNILRTENDYCKNYVDHDSCFTDVVSRTQITRGCTSDGVHIASAYEKRCSTPYCNKDHALATVTCWECDSNLADELACKLGKEDYDELGKCKIEVLYGHQGFCYVRHDGNHVQRGCSYDSPVTNESIHFKTCQTSLCNNQDTTISHCYQCETENDENCVFMEDNKVAVASCPIGTSSCYTCRDFGNVTKRGCGEPDQCVGLCSICSNGELCNSNCLYECYLCSSADDHDCELLLSPERIDREMCYKGCQVSLENDVLQRGCLVDKLECNDSNMCSPCFSDNCNSYYIDGHCGVLKYIDSEDWSDLEDEPLLNLP